MDDFLSDIFKRIQLQGCVYFKQDFTRPWGMHMNVPGIAQFHHVTRGQCVLEMNGMSYHGASGDIFLLPRGGEHILLDQTGSVAVAGSDVMTSIVEGNPLFRDGEVATQLICGHYEYRDDLHHPLISQLPDIIHIKSREMSEPGDLHGLVSLIIGELSSVAPGATIIVEKLAEVILVKLMRMYLATVKQPTGFLAALGDERLVHALNFMHRNSHENIPLEALAQAAGMSRSNFAARFKQVTGLSPAAYLARWRMFLACDMLRAGGLSVVQVAENIGYESEISFSRAFKRHLEVTPAEYRRQAT